MKVLHIVGGLAHVSGGPTRSISGLCRALALAGVETTLLILRPEHDMSNPCGVRIVKGRGVGIMKIWREVTAIINEIQPDIVHMHALWMPTSHIPIYLAHKNNRPVMLSTRGNLDPWALKQKAMKKKIALWCYQRKSLLRVSCFHATAEQESKNIRELGLTQPIWVIPNGVDVPETLPERVSRQDGLKIALFLSRLHPGKGLIDLVQAWARVRPRGWQMRIVGPDVCGHKAAVQAEILKFGLEPDFVFVGDLDDESKWHEYANADLFVHPSHSENFGISIAEALAAGLPVITTKGTPWPELQGISGSSKVPDFRTTELSNVHISRCGWWIDVGVVPLANALNEALNMSDGERRCMGNIGQQLVKAKYEWPTIATHMKRAYASIINK